MDTGRPGVDILGSRVHIFSVNSAVESIESLIRSRDGVCHQVIVSGFHGLWEAYRDPRLHHVFNSADMWVADGIAPILVARLKGIRGMSRIPGPDLMKAFLTVANDKGYRSYFYGDTQETLTCLRHKLAENYPGHRFCGEFSPPFRPLTPKEDMEIVHRINAAVPDVVWVGLGTPKQDVWIFEHREQLNAPVAIGVGAAFRFHAGLVKRAPRVIGNIGLEWLWRFVMEPRKLWRRDLLEGPQFLFHVGLELAGRKRSDNYE